MCVFCYYNLIYVIQEQLHQVCSTHTNVGVDLNQTMSTRTWKQSRPVICLARATPVKSVVEQI